MAAGQENLATGWGRVEGGVASLVSLSPAADSTEEGGSRQLATNGSRPEQARVDQQDSQAPLILITESAGCQPEVGENNNEDEDEDDDDDDDSELSQEDLLARRGRKDKPEEPEEQVEEIDGISYRIVPALTKPRPQRKRQNPSAKDDETMKPEEAQDKFQDGSDNQRVATKSKGSKENGRLTSSGQLGHLGRSASQRQSSNLRRGISSIRRKSSAFVAGSLGLLLGPQPDSSTSEISLRPRRMSIYEMTKSPPPETSIEMYLSERRRSSTVSSALVQQQIAEQQSTFEANYAQRQQYFKDLNLKLINQDSKLLNVVANRGKIHRHSVDIAQLPLEKALASKMKEEEAQKAPEVQTISTGKEEEDESSSQLNASNKLINQRKRSSAIGRRNRTDGGSDPVCRRSGSIRLSSDGLPSNRRIVRRFMGQLDDASSSPAPDVKIGQRVAHREYYGTEFGTIRWIGRVPQLSNGWTVGVEFDNAIGEGDGSLNGRRYFIAKDCFAKFLPLDQVALVEQHVGRPEPGTMISVMSAASKPGQLISIQRVSTVHVQHCFLNAPHRKRGVDLLAVNSRLHCQCPNCGPCAHVVKPPRTQRLAGSTKNATHMCQFSTYTCCGMESQEEALCTYVGNKVSAEPPPPPVGWAMRAGLPPVGNSWISGSGYLSNLQAQQSKLLPDEYRMGATPDQQSTRTAGRSGSRKRGHRSRNGTKLDEETNQTERIEEAAKPPNYDESQQIQNIFTPISTASMMSSSINNNNIQPHPPSHRLSQGELDSADHPAILIHTNDQSPPTTPCFRQRLSIENRYLFPADEIPQTPSCTHDDAISSTLEADIENLSQARYGNSRRSRPSSSNTGTHRQSATQLSGSSRLFRSLRSLVSCHHQQQQQQQQQQANSESPSDDGEEDDDCQREVQLHRKLGRLHQKFDFDNRNSYNAQSQPLPNKSAASFGAPKYSVESGTRTTESITSSSTGSECESSNNRPPNRHENFHLSSNHHQDRKSRHSNQDRSSRLTGRQVSTSSDCGFSSLNSYNGLVTSGSPPSSTRPSGQTLNGLYEEDRKWQHLYERLAGRLVSLAQLGEEDLVRLRTILLEPHHLNECRLLPATISRLGKGDSCSDPSSPGARSKVAECEQLLAELIQRSMKSTDLTSDGGQCCGCGCGCAIDRSQEAKTEIAGDSNQEKQQQQQPQQPPIANNCPSATMQNPTASELPNAFELRLTLSINKQNSQVGLESS